MLHIATKNTVRTILTIAAAFFVGLVLLASPVSAQTTPKDSVCEGIGLTAGQTGNTSCAPTGGTQIEDVIAAAINLISIVVGVIAVIMIIIGGLKYIMSSGDSNNINSAKNTILYAIIGLVIVALAQVIVRYVIDKAT